VNINEALKKKKSKEKKEKTGVFSYKGDCSHQKKKKKKKKNKKKKKKKKERKIRQFLIEQVRKFTIEMK
jgi:hypothetical protein